MTWEDKVNQDATIVKKWDMFNTQCPANALAVTEETSDQSMLSRGIVEGQQVDDILLDTGCFRTFVHQRLIPSMRYLPERKSIQCAHRRNRLSELY